MVEDEDEDSEIPNGDGEKPEVMLIMIKAEENRTEDWPALWLGWVSSHTMASPEQKVYLDQTLKPLLQRLVQDVTTKVPEP